MEIDIKNYDLELIEGIIKKYRYYGRGVSMYVFDYKSYKLAKKVVDQKNAIYIISQTKNINKGLYIGQTTQGPERFAEHKMKSYRENAEIYYFTFDNKPTRNILDSIERRMISVLEEEGYPLKNSNKGITTDIENRESQYIADNIVVINFLLQIVGINIEKAESTKEVKLSIKRSESPKVIKYFDEEFIIPGFKAQISRKGENWILRKGSETKALQYWEKYSDKPNTDNYRFVKRNLENIDEEGVVINDIVWRTISPIVAFVKARNSNGWIEIVNKENKTPDYLYRNQNAK